VTDRSPLPLELDAEAMRHLLAELEALAIGRWAHDFAASLRTGN
jgi:hypothetical protein